jgi:AmiR/NasT family two-component response regulator
MLANVRAKYAAERASAQMAAAVAHRDEVRMATGIIMERGGLGPDQALSRIIDLCRLWQKALIDTAQDIVAGRPTA